MKVISVMLAFIFLVVTLGSVSAQTVQYHPSLVHKPGAMAYEHTQYLSQEIGRRIAGTEAEQEAADYIYSQFERIGFETEMQNFPFLSSGSYFRSANVIAYKPGQSDEQIIVGAHYDSVSAGLGADDNASGVGVMLEVAEKLHRVKTPYSIVFIAFGAEEVGLRGSNFYAGNMSKGKIDQTVGMINLDSLIAGDYMYVYGDEGEDGFMRDQALNIAEKKKLDIQTNPGLNPDYPEGTTGDWSDHAPFKRLGIPYSYLEATNWEIGDLDGYTQTEDHGSIWHSNRDTLEFIEAEFPGRVEKHLSSFSTLLTDMLKFMNKTATAK